MTRVQLETLRFRPREENDAQAREHAAQKQRHMRLWWILLAATVVLMLLGTAIILAGGYLAKAKSPISPFHYMGSLFTILGGAISVAWSSRSLYDEDEPFDAAKGWLAWGVPFIALLAWGITHILLHAFLRGWQAPIPFLVNHPIGLYFTTFAFGFGFMVVYAKVVNLACVPEARM